MMRKTALFAVKRRFIFAAAFLLAAAFGAWLAGRANVNYDMTKYLPEDSLTAEALKVMEEEFGGVGYLQAMVSEADRDTAEGLAEILKETDGVDSVMFDADSEEYYQGDKALFKIYLSHSDFSREASDTIELIKKKLEGRKLALSGYAVEAGYNRDMIKADLGKILVLSIAVVLAILLLTSRSWADPLVFFCNLGVALLINVGTNALLDSISFVSQSVCAVLQMALAMDYSIIILHRYHEEREKTEDKKEAMAAALTASFTSVAASSLTTIAGLCALMFMRFKIGLDIGGVLAKGIACSLLSSFFFMPAVIIACDRLMKMTLHKRLIPDMKGLAAFASGKKLWLPVMALILFIGAYFMQRRLEFIYDIEVNRNSKVYSDREAINEAFGIQNPLIVLVPKGDKEKEREVMAYAASIDYKGERPISGASGLASTGLYDELALEEAAERFGTSAENMRGVYAALGSEGRKAFVYDILKYLKESGYIERLAEEKQKEADGLCSKVKELYASITAADMAAKYGLDSDTANALWAAMGAEPDDRLAPDAVLSYLHRTQFFMDYADKKQEELREQYEAALKLAGTYTAEEAAGSFHINRSAVYGIMYELGAEGFDENARLTKAQLIKYLYETTGDSGLEAYYASVQEAEERLDAERIQADPLLGKLFGPDLTAAVFREYGADPASDSLTRYQILQYVSRNQLIKEYAPAMSGYQDIYDAKYAEAKALYDELTYKEAAAAFGLAERQAFAVYCTLLPEASAGLRIEGRELLAWLYEKGGAASLRDSYEAMKRAFAVLDREAVIKLGGMYDEAAADAVIRRCGGPVYAYQLIGYALENNLVMKYAEAAQEEAELRYLEAAEAARYMTAGEISSAYGISGKWIDEIFAHFGVEAGGSVKKADLAVYASESSLPLRIGRGLREEVDRKWDEALYAIDRFEGGRYSRLIFNISSEVAGDEAAYVVKTLRRDLSRYYGEYYVLGSSANICDIRETFSTDIININVINILAVFIIVMLLYRSVSMPLLLVACIQGAIFVGLSINAAAKSPVYFVCYLVAICIQMGATIDYGILLTDRYCAFRRTFAPSEAIRKAVCVSSPTILTSGLVFVIAAAIVGWMATVPIIAYIGRLISRGAAVSVLTVLLVLPQCLRLFDVFIEKGSLRGKFKREG